MIHKEHHALVVEDNVFLAKTIESVLAERGVRVTVSHNGKDAISVVKEDVPDLVLLDLLLPHTDGFAFLRHIREIQIDVPVIVLTNLDDQTNQDMCRKLGVSDYLVKSHMDDEQLWPVVERYLR